MSNTAKEKVITELKLLLANTYVLYLKTQNFHWNITGPYFHSLHLMFEGQYLQLAEAVDVIAERIRTLGSVTPASFAHFLKLTTLKEENNVPSATEMLSQLLNDHVAIAEHTTALLKHAEELGDEGTIDLLVERMKEHEKSSWMLRSSL